MQKELQEGLPNKVTSECIVLSYSCYSVCFCCPAWLLHVFFVMFF